MDLIHGYHMECYRKFAALSKAQHIKLSQNNVEESESHIVNEETRCAKVTPRVTTKDAKSNHSVSNTGIFPLVCLFWNQKIKKVQRLIKVTGSKTTIITLDLQLLSKQ